MTEKIERIGRTDRIDIEKKTFAKFIRVITVPPIMVFLLLIILFLTRATIYTGVPQLLLSILFLMLVPVAAYPLSAVIPHYKIKGREGQRNLAFVLSLAGYVAAIVYGLATHVSRELLLVYLTYLLSAVILTMFNKIIKLRASGHACSITGPLILMVYFIGWKCVLPCAILLALIYWASLTLKRHTLTELLTGGGTAAVAFVIGLLFVLL